MYSLLLKTYHSISYYLIVLNLPRLLALFIIIPNFKKILFNKNCKIILNTKALTVKNELDFIISHNNKKNIYSIEISLRILKIIFNNFYGRPIKTIDRIPIMTLKQTEKINKFSNYSFWETVKDYPENQKKITKFLVKFLSVFKFFDKPITIFCQNFVYSYIYDLFEAAKIMNIDCIVYMKETVSPPGHQNFIVKNFYIRTKFNGSKILFYSKEQKHFYLGVEGIRGNCEHIGSAKSDEILKKYSEKKQIKYEAGLFFSSAQDKMNGIPEEISQRLDILNKVEQFHINFIKVANKLYDKKFLIKMKKDQHKYQYLQPLLKKYDTKLGPNISLKSETDNAQLLISKSKKIFVFHSTIISEAILMNKNVIEPKFEPINDLEKSYLFTGNFENATIKVDNANEIERVINLESLNTDTRHKNELINYYLGPCDGKVFDRFISHL